MSTTSAWTVVTASFFLGEVAIVSGLILLERRKVDTESARPLAQQMSAVRTQPDKGPHASSWLLLSVLCAALTSLGDLLRHMGLEGVAHVLTPFVDPPLLLLGPALWFFTCSLTGESPANKPSWRPFAIHAAPAVVIFWVLAFEVVVSNPQHIRTPAERSSAEIVSLLPVAAHLMFYLVAVQRRIRSTRLRLVDAVSNLENRRLIWLSAAALLLKALLVMWIVSWLWERAVSDLVTNLLLACWLGLVGLFGIHQRNVFVSLPDKVPTVRFSESNLIHISRDGAEDRPTSASATQPAKQSSSNQGKYAKAGLGADLAQAIAGRLEKVMAEDKLYLDHELSLAELSQAVSCTPHQLSQVLSAHLGESFYDYVNSWRVMAVQATLMRPQSTGRPLLELALECGFGSKSAFNEAFKRVAGMSPSAYRKGLPASARSSAAVDQNRSNGPGRENT